MYLLSLLLEVNIPKGMRTCQNTTLLQSLFLLLLLLFWFLLLLLIVVLLLQLLLPLHVMLVVFEFPFFFLSYMTLTLPPRT